jgi:hypothetical protein
MVGLLEAYHDVRGSYPLRILHTAKRAAAGRHDLVIPEGTVPSHETTPGPDGTTIIDCRDFQIVYWPVVAGGDTVPRGYRVSLRGRHGHIRDLRSYLAETDGRIHSTGENREATPSDPEAPDDEWVPGIRQRTRELFVRQLELHGI